MAASADKPDASKPSVCEAELLYEDGQPYQQLRLRFPRPVRARPTVGPTLLITVVDCSGSMAGRPIDQVKQSLTHFLAGAGTDAHIIPEIVTYHSSAKQLVVRNGDFRAAIAGIRAEGTTNFSAAFQETERLIRLHTRAKNVVVVFMTDGEDSAGPEKAVKACDAHSQALRKLGRESIVFHTLGFNKQHHFALLDKIRTAGTRAGYFRYAETDDGIDVLKRKFAEIFEIAVSSASTVPVTLVCPGLTPVGGGAFPSAVECDDTGVCALTCWVRRTRDGEPTPVVTVTVEGSHMEIPLVRRPQAHGVGVWRVLVCEAELERLATDIAQAAKDGKLSAATHGAALARLTDQLKAVAVFGQRGVGKAAREEILSARAELQERLDALHRVVASAATAAATADKTSLMARAADIAYTATFTKARRQRAIDRRVVSNTTSALSVEDQLVALQTARAAGPAAAVVMSKEALEFYFCTLTQCHVVDLMETDATEVLGFGLAVQRPEAVVDCPTLLNVHAISTTLCSRSTMQDAVRFAISIEGHVRTHGGLGWQGELGVALRGRAREPINAWVPLYINQAHWARVSLLLPSSLGYLVCLNPLAYDPEQLNVLFMLLGTMAARLGTDSSERDVQLFFSVARTCRAVAEDFGVLAKITAKLHEFTVSQSGRTKDVMSNLLTMLGYAFVVDHEALDLQAFFAGLVGETARRAASTLLKHRSDATAAEIAYRLVYPKNTRVAGPALVAALTALTVEDGPNVTAPAASDPFTDWAFSVDAVCSDATADTVDAEFSSAMSRNVMQMLVGVGHVACDTVPGPNIVQKTTKLRELAARWWDGLRKGVALPETTAADTGAPRSVPAPAAAAAAAAIVDAPSAESTTDPAPDPAPAAAPASDAPAAEVTLPASIAETMVVLERELSRVAAPGWAGLHRAHALLGLWQRMGRETAAAGKGTVWDVLDESSGLPPPVWLAEVVALRRPGAATLAGLVAATAAPEDLLLTLRALMVYVVRYHSNRAARAVGEAAKAAAAPAAGAGAAAAGGFIDVSDEGDDMLAGAGDEFPRTVAGARAVLVAYERWLAPMVANLQQAMVDNIRNKRANRIMCELDDMHAFVGVLTTAYTERGQGFNELLDLFKRPDAKIRRRAEKLKVMLSGRFEDHAVFCRGNSWLPSLGDARTALIAAVGHDEYMAIEMALRSRTVSHVYRPSDLPNRHGYCNSHPHEPGTCSKCHAAMARSSSY